MTTNDQDARALTYLARRLRTETSGAGEWDEAGTWAVISRMIGQNLGITVERVTRHAADPSAKTPGAINRPFTPGAPTALAPRAPSREHQCWSCGRGIDDCNEDHPKRRPESTGVDHAAQAQAARAAMQAATQRSTAHE